MNMSTNEKLRLIIIILLTEIVLFFGWRTFLFLTDDAYISFRYVSNSILGYGYVWNPPPFRPVEGYSNFLWIVLLDVVWRLFKMLPPESSNYLSLFFSFLTLIAGAVMTLRVVWDSPLHRHRIIFIGLVMAGIVANRTFLAWSSSGLETAMFNFFVTAWVYSCVFVPITSDRWIFYATASAACLYLTRPDGMLFVLGTALMLFAVRWRNRPFPRRVDLLGALPLVVVPLHLWWRRHEYGEWLPNTYYAKLSGMWPESGVRYLLSFVLEYALWVWLGLLVLVMLKKRGSALRGLLQPRTGYALDRISPKGEALYFLPATVAVSVLLLHIAYYTIVVGGDHFEFRVFSHLVPLILVSFVWLLRIAGFRAGISISVLSAFIVLSLPIPWTHWALSSRLVTRKQTYIMRVAVAPHWPKYIRWYAGAFDGLQFWLIEHFVCMRHQEHKMCLNYFASVYPSREEGMLLPCEGHPVHFTYSAGYPAWVLPKVAVIDYWGLNDYVIARNRGDSPGMRMMAHERKPPIGYIECFRPNVGLTPNGEIEIKVRDVPLTEDDIIACEENWAERIE